MEFEGKAAIVTGASGGLGRAIAVALGTAGAQVGLVARSREGREETRRLIGQPDARVFCTDLRDEQAIAQLGASVTANLGPVDILVNCAGVWHDERTRFHGPRLLETPVERISEVLEVGVRAPLWLARMLLPGMVQRGAGKILQISAAFGAPRDGVGWVQYYVANKALDAFTEALAVELREYKIQVNCIAPVFVATDAVRRFYASEIQSEQALDPLDVAQLALFLLSSRADHISGQVIAVRSKDDHG
ncbi:MAG: SDR family oxidoreductase [Acidobacteria bacterium]|nr:MAG: SDR family oxidoreductase [Acidobacteriota bacterium]